MRGMQSTADRTTTDTLIPSLIGRLGNTMRAEEQLSRDCFAKIVSGELWNLRRMEKGQSATRAAQPLWPY